MRMQEDEYKKISVLGQGAYGEVWLVVTKNNEQFAMKNIAVKATEEGIPQSVLREVCSLVALQKLRHPNILRLHDAFVKRKEDRISVSIISEKCDWDLCDFLRNIPQDMCNAQCQHFARQILSGIDFLHTNNVIHRDLKPQNILVNKDQTLRVRKIELIKKMVLISYLLKGNLPV